MAMLRILPAAMLAASTAMSALTIAPAHADDTSFLAELRTGGEDVEPITELPFLLYGKSMCDNLRRGYDPFRATTFVDRAKHGDRVLWAAQHHLCPETLPPPPPPA